VTDATFVNRSALGRTDSRWPNIASYKRPILTTFDRGNTAWRTVAPGCDTGADSVSRNGHFAAPIDADAQAQRGASGRPCS